MFLWVVDSYENIEVIEEWEEREVVHETRVRWKHGDDLQR